MSDLSWLHETRLHGCGIIPPQKPTGEPRRCHRRSSGSDGYGLPVIAGKGAVSQCPETTRKPEEAAREKAYLHSINAFEMLDSIVATLLERRPTNRNDIEVATRDGLDAFFDSSPQDTLQRALHSISIKKGHRVAAASALDALVGVCNSVSAAAAPVEEWLRGKREVVREARAKRKSKKDVAAAVGPASVESMKIISALPALHQKTLLLGKHREFCERLREMVEETAHMCMKGVRVAVHYAEIDDRPSKGDVARCYETGTRSVRQNEDEVFMAVPVVEGAPTLAVAQFKWDASGDKEALALQVVECLLAPVLTVADVLLTTHDRFTKFVGIIEGLSQADYSSMDTILNTIIASAQQAVSAAQGSLFLVSDGQLRSISEEIAFPCDSGIAGYCLANNTSLNIHDAYKDPRFNPEIDRKTGLKTKSLLTIPVVSNDQVKAVIQVMNKIGPPGHFTDVDEVNLLHFSHFAGVALRNARLYQAMAQSNTETLAVLGRTRKLNSMLDVTQHEVNGCLEIPLPTDQATQVLSPSFDVLSFDEADPKLVGMVVYLFESLNMLQSFAIPKDCLVRFILATRTRYRKVPYHSFAHAVDVTATVHSFLTRGGAIEEGKVTLQEAFTLLVSALLHDVDHMGLNNAIRFTSTTPLGMLSAASGVTSILEVHHCRVALEILEHPQVSLFSFFPSDDESMYKLLIDYILSTDMSKHHALLEKFDDMMTEGFKSDKPEHRALVGMLLLKCADLSNVSKPFETSKKWSLALSREVNQGKTPTICPELAQQQISFMETFVSPMAEKVVGLLPNMSFFLNDMHSNRVLWNSLTST